MVTPMLEPKASTFKIKAATCSHLLKHQRDPLLDPMLQNANRKNYRQSVVPTSNPERRRCDCNGAPAKEGTESQTRFRFVLGPVTDEKQLI